MVCETTLGELNGECEGTAVVITLYATNIRLL